MIEKNSVVRFVGSTDYDGNSIKSWHEEYKVLEKNGDRIVLTYNGEIFAAVNVAACELV